MKSKGDSSSWLEQRVDPSVFVPFKFSFRLTEGRGPEKKKTFFWALPKLPIAPPQPQFEQLVKLFSDVKIKDLKVSLGLKILFILYKYNLKTVESSNHWHFERNRLFY